MQPHGGQHITPHHNNTNHQTNTIACSYQLTYFPNPILTCPQPYLPTFRQHQQIITTSTPPAKPSSSSTHHFHRPIYNILSFPISLFLFCFFLFLVARFSGSRIYYLFLCRLSRHHRGHTYERQQKLTPLFGLPRLMPVLLPPHPHCDSIYTGHWEVPPNPVRSPTSAYRHRFLPKMGVEYIQAAPWMQPDAGPRAASLASTLINVSKLISNTAASQCRSCRFEKLKLKLN